MTMEKGGLVKLSEEMCELGQVVAKKMAYYDTDEHPDGAGSLKSRMEDEMGDVLAATDFVTTKFELDYDRISARRVRKLDLYRKWDREP